MGNARRQIPPIMQPGSPSGLLVRPARPGGIITASYIEMQSWILLKAAAPDSPQPLNGKVILSSTVKNNYTDNVNGCKMALKLPSKIVITNKSPRYPVLQLFRDNNSAGSAAMNLSGTSVSPAFVGAVLRVTPITSQFDISVQTWNTQAFNLGTPFRQTSLALAQSTPATNVQPGQLVAGLPGSISQGGFETDPPLIAVTLFPQNVSGTWSWTAFGFLIEAMPYVSVPSGVTSSLESVTVQSINTPLKKSGNCPALIV